MVFDRGNVLGCDESGNIIINRVYSCNDELNKKHNFEHLIRCASSEFGFPELPFRGKCNCLPGATGSHCQFSDKNTCNCNGVALPDGYCNCKGGFKGFYCEIGDNTKLIVVHAYQP